MKKNIILIASTLFIFIIAIGGYLNLKNKKDTQNNGMFAIMLETAEGTGKYEHAGNNAWPTGDEYVINMYKTYCEKGSVLRWSEESKKVNATVKGSDKCYVYFDISEYGNEEHPYLIQTIEDLVRLSNDVNSGTNYAGKYFLLTTDLDFQDESDYEDATRTDFKDINGINGDEALIEELTSGSGFVPIGGSEANAFQGILDGNNHYIKNLYINNETTSGKRMGLFGNIRNSKIANINITGQINSDTVSMTGGIVGVAYDNVEIKNCHTDVKITGSSDSGSGNSLGGIIGIVPPDANVKITDSQSKGDLLRGTNAGGLVSWNRGTLSIRNCENLANVGESSYNGGIVAYNSNVLTIEDTVNKGNIHGKSNIGGLVAAQVSQLVIKNSVNYGEVSTDLGLYMGGLIGQDNAAATKTEVINSHNEGKVIQNTSTGSSCVGGIIGRIRSSITIEGSYNAGTINGKLDTYTATSSNRYGGLIGRKENAGTIIINKSYNSGDIEIIGNSFTALYIGGLVGAFNGNVTDEAKLLILNSYNTGNFKHDVGSTSRKGGLVGETHNKINAYIINSYNLGAISGGAYAIGIIFDNSNDAINSLVLKNIYNLGNMNSTYNEQIYRSLSFDEGKQAEVEIANVYYPDGLSATNRTDISFTPKAKDDMLTQAFVEELNSNIKNIDLGAMDASLKSYKLSSWQLGSDGYPTLINE